MYVWNWDIEIPLLIGLSTENSQRVWNEFYINDPLEDPNKSKLLKKYLFG